MNYQKSKIKIVILNILKNENMKRILNNKQNWQRTDTLFFGSMFGMTLTVLLVVLFNITIFKNTLLENDWISIFWVSILLIIIIPVRLFPNSNWSKWWRK